MSSGGCVIQTHIINEKFHTNHTNHVHLWRQEHTFDNDDKVFRLPGCYILFIEPLDEVSTGQGIHHPCTRLDAISIRFFTNYHPNFLIKQRCACLISTCKKNLYSFIMHLFFLLSNCYWVENYNNTNPSTILTGHSFYQFPLHHTHFNFH